MSTVILRMLGLVVILSRAAASLGGAPPSPTPPRAVFRGGIDMVQIDAVVTDGKGRHVTDLKADDFEVIEDGRRQALGHCEYVATAADAPEEKAPSLAPATPATPAAPLTRESVRRSIAVVIDDLGLSFSDMLGVRDGLKKFIESDFGPGDLVAIVRTSGGMGLLQQFTTDKEILRAAVESLRYNGLAVGARTTAERVEETSVGAEALGSSEADALAVNVEEMRQDLLMRSKLAALRHVVDGLRTMPGRRSVIFFSSNMEISRPGERGREIYEALHGIADRANRSSVVLYTIDARGLEVHMPTRAGKAAPLAPSVARTSGHLILAYETGGTFQHNSNRLDYNVRQVMLDQKGYYVLGYLPTEAESGRRARSDHRVTVRVKRPGLRVRHRSKYSGRLESDEPPPSRTESLVADLASPFSQQELGVQITPVLLRDNKDGYIVRIFIHVDGAGLSVEDDGPERRRTRLELATAAFSDDGVPVNMLMREISLPFPPERLPSLREEGLELELTIPVRRPGAYQLRAAVRDVVSGRRGNARQFLPVPERKKGRLSMSGIVLSGLPGTADPRAHHAVRQFKPGTSLLLAFVVYDSTRPGAAASAVTTTARLYRNDVLLSTSAVATTVAAPPPPAQADAKRSPEAEGQWLLGSVHLAPTIKPDEYILEVVVHDPLAKPPHNTARQRIDFAVRSADTAAPDDQAAP